MPFVAARRVMSDQISKRVVWVVQPGLRAMISLVTFVLGRVRSGCREEGDVDRIPVHIAKSVDHGNFEGHIGAVAVIDLIDHLNCISPVRIGSAR
jgi:hypothetical protein